MTRCEAVSPASLFAYRKKEKKAFLAEARREKTREELEAGGYLYIEWDGRPIYFIDCNNILFAVLTGHPDAKDYPIAGLRLPMPLPHRRGKFKVINFGVHHGQGGKHLTMLGLNKGAESVFPGITVNFGEDVQCDGAS